MAETGGSSAALDSSAWEPSLARNERALPRDGVHLAVCYDINRRPHLIFEKLQPGLLLEDQHNSF